MRRKDIPVIAVLLLGAFACLWRGLTPGEPASRSVMATTPVTHSPPQVVEQAIETVRVGQRVWIGDNPSHERDLEVGEDITDPRLWREMRLRSPKRDGTLADVRMLRPAGWLEERGVHPGGRVDIEVPECGISGLADVLEVLPCPEITPGQGRVVTATFHHQAAQTIDVAVEGLEEPIGSTPNHPFWSETHGEFVRADQLSPGDEVRTLHGTARVTGVTPRGPPEPVYNLEVQCEHVYRVANAGLLVHNGTLNPQCPDILFREDTLRRPDIDTKKPFNQSLSDENPIEVVIDKFGNTHIVQGNHRVQAAREQGLNEVGVNAYTQKEWEDLHGLKFNHRRGTRIPTIK